jgi:hypothetical protein
MERLTPDYNGKQILAVVEKCPNYIFHLMAVAKVGFESEYADIYMNSVLPEDIAFIKEHENLLSMGGVGYCGDLLPIMLFFPAYINLESVNALREYFFLLDSGFQANNFQAFLKRYAFYNEKLKSWSPVEEEHLKSLSQYREIIAKLGNIYLRNYTAYEEKVWNKEIINLDKVALEINEYFKDREVITKWENLTGMTFKFANYNIVLCSAIKGGPNANSLGYERNVFHHDRPFDYMTQFISHEVGTHIMIDVYRDIYYTEVEGLKAFDMGVLYGAYENLAKFYNTMIFKDINMVYNMLHFHDKEYLEIFQDKYNENPNITPKDLLVKGINTFLKKASKTGSK